MNKIWESKKDKIKQKFAVISKRDLMFKVGREEEMFLKLRKKLGKTDDQILSIIIDS